ncbi:CRISPR-associated protein Csh2 [Ruminiclostridium sufflavum DSM 19573]|uniref:CRISPR-associated protein Csh2 n=1 Tax=Ruminiclostridium sufflavum DSM 19573 TaxID=1121337 RepID=A0A318XIC9_9FIRM|nr:type I CRISPR-associated protein Cas7 [Ruminiclostridium sufflavum]PYG86980.1 CRISPR-associated protein Csh2 [Ruminiclostridium sufflavum DSM 19573]
MKMNNRVYGIAGIKSCMANWNADFTGRPKAVSSGDIFGSDKAFKYPCKKMWQNEGERIMYIKTYKIGTKGKGEDAEKLQPKELKERYEELFGYELNKKLPSDKVLRDLFSCMDVMNFGATFAQEGQNISITGAVQVGQGFNKYNNTVVEVQDILSPFRNSKKEDADASSLGSKVMVDEAHYVYPFSVNPDNYSDYVKLMEGFEGYTREAYERFKSACLVAATAFNTNSKSGCENEFAIFIEFNEDSKAYLPPLDQYVEFVKGDTINRLDLTRLSELLKSVGDKIQAAEIFYNPFTFEKPELQGVNYSAYSLFERA